MTDLSRIKVLPLALLEVTHIAVFRNAYGVVTAMRPLFLPLANNEFALDAAYGLKGSLDVYCDVFLLDHADRIGGLKFREQQG